MIMDAEEKPVDPDNLKEQHHSMINERSISSSTSQDTATIDQLKGANATEKSGSVGSSGNHTLCSPNIYAPQPQSFYHGGFENANVDWDECTPYVNSEVLEFESQGIYNDNPSLLFHSGYGYNPQMQYGQYSPVTASLPPIGEDGQLYTHFQFPYSVPPYYQQPVPPSMPYLPSSTPVSQLELPNMINVDQRGDSILYGPRPSYLPVGSFDRGSYPGISGTLGFLDSQQSYRGLHSVGIWSDDLKPLDRQRSLVSPLSPAVSPMSIGLHGSFGQSVGMVCEQQRSSYGFGSGSNSYSKRGMTSRGFSFGGAAVSVAEANGQSWLSFVNGKRQARAGGSLCSCNGSFHIFNEQNRGPRSLKMKNQISAEDSSSVGYNKHSSSAYKILNESFNLPDFVMKCKDAKFFIIKSYSEDNVHKSIKYGIWASTPNGSRKLDAAYRQVQEKQETSLVFLFFSVNASAQFCGVAEMVGPVDFNKSVDYWQQNKWSGQFPVRWHLIKDVPNSQFRHIILENNDSKPVTNSRDTQEVKAEQGIEMLKIFKNYETDMSVLDDFDFYEEREKAMQERKVRQQANMMAIVGGVVGENEHRNSAASTLTGSYVKQMPKSFAEVVCLDEGGKEVAGTKNLMA